MEKLVGFIDDAALSLRRTKFYKAYQRLTGPGHTGWIAGVTLKDKLRRIRVNYRRFKILDGRPETVALITRNNTAFAFQQF